MSALEKSAIGGQSASWRADANVMAIDFTNTQSHEHLVYGKDRLMVRAEHVRSLLHDAA